MGGIEQLRIAVARIEELDKWIAAISREKNKDWRLELVKARRELAEAIGQAANAISDCEHGKDLDARRIKELRAVLSSFRSALALHQASHPASGIDGSASYLASARTVVQMHQQFVQCARTILG